MIAEAHSRDLCQHWVYVKQFEKYGAHKAKRDHPQAHLRDAFAADAIAAAVTHCDCKTDEDCCGQQQYERRDRYTGKMEHPEVNVGDHFFFTALVTNK
jgi:hypothetical protein